MPAPAEESRAVHFGLFEVNLQESELRKSGIRIKLQEQPFQILTILLEHAGETVTRGELRRRLWPADTFVDFDHNLNSGIKKLREALGDDSENPRFIQTLHRRGYRFIAPVDVPRAVVVERTEQTPPEPVATASRRSVVRWQKWLATAVITVGAASVGYWLRSPLPPPRIVGSQELTNDGLLKDSLVTDGYRIYFTESLPGNSKIAQVSVNGGEIAPVDSSISNPVLQDVSPSRSELLVARNTWSLDGFNRAMWSIPLPAGAPRRLGEVSGLCAAWGPSGKLVFAKGRDLYIAEHDGSNPRKFAIAPDTATGLSFSPDGARFRFTVSNRINLTSEIWEAQADGSDMHPVFPGWNNPPAECCGHWIADGKYYVFQSTRKGATNLWIVQERSVLWKKAPLEPVPLTIGPLRLSSPLPSTDRKKLFAIGTHERAELVRYDAKSDEFVPYLGGISASDVDFSRDGQWITYVSLPDLTLWRSKLDGSARLQLTNLPMKAAVAHWSPDGQQIAFSGMMPGKPWKLFLMSKDGGTPQAVTAEEITETDPTWSPDGKALAFGHYNVLDPDKTFIELFKVETRQISELPGSRGIFSPRWSPNGRYIAAASHHADKLMLHDVKNGKWRQLGNTLQSGYGYFDWSRDSAYVYFDVMWSGGNGYFRLRISDARLEKLADLKKIRRFPDQFDWTWSGLGPNDTPMFVHDIITQEIYALDLQLP